MIRQAILLIAAISASLLSSVISEIRPCGAQTAPEQERVVFLWTMGAIRSTAEGRWKFDPIRGDTALNSGDRMKFYIKPITRCFFYLVYQNSQGNLFSLFSSRLNDTNIEDQFSKGYLIPEGAQWFLLDENTGKERFILLSSLERLAQLEALITSYEVAGNGEKSKLGSQILDEIASVRVKNSKLKTPAERPVTIIGQVRGTERLEVVSNINLADYAVEITAEKFYSRTFTIDHR